MTAYPPTESAEADLDQERALARAHARIEEMASGLSMLSSASARLADTLKKRNQQYDALLAYQGTQTRRLEAVQTELNLASAELATSQAQVNDRNARLVDLQARLESREASLETVAAEKSDLEAQIASLQDQLAALGAEKSSLEAGIEERDRSAAELKAQLEVMNSSLVELQTRYDETAAAKADAEQKLQAAQDQMAAGQKQLAEWEAELAEVLPEGEPSQAASVSVGPAEGGGEPETTESGGPYASRLAAAGVVSAGIAAAISRGKEQEVRLEEATARLASLQDQIAALNAENSALKESWLEKDQAAAGLQAQLDETNASLADLQSQLATATAAQADAEQKLQAAEAESADLRQQLAELTAAKSEVEQQLQASEAQVADLEQQIESWQSALGGEVPEVVPPEGEAAPPEEEKGRGARWLAKAGVVTAGIAKTVSHKKEQEAKLAELQSQLDGESAAKADAEQKLQAAEAEAADLKQQLANLELTPDETEEQLRASQAQVAELENRLAGWQTELAAVLPAEERPVEDAEAASSRVGLVAAGITALVALSRQKDGQLKEATAELSSLHERVGALGAEKALLESRLKEKEQDPADLQAPLDAAMPAEIDAEQQLQPGQAGPAGHEEQPAEWQGEAPPVETTTESTAVPAPEGPEPGSDLPRAETVAEAAAPEITGLSGGLTSVEGLGPASAAALKGIGIKTKQNLLESGATAEGRAKIAAQSGISEKLVAKWVSAVDLSRVRGVSGEYGELLVAAGVVTAAKLAEQESGKLRERLVEVNAQKHLVRLVPGMPQLEKWIGEAKELPPVVTI